MIDHMSWFLGDSGGPIFIYENEHWEQVGIQINPAYCKRQERNINSSLILW